jgi:hypothetical protein
MGFEKGKILEALKVTNGNKEQATNMLLSE